MSFTQRDIPIGNDDIARIKGIGKDVVGLLVGNVALRVARKFGVLLQKSGNFRLCFKVPASVALKRLLKDRCEPPRDCRRPFVLNYAAMGVSSSMA